MRYAHGLKSALDRLAPQSRRTPLPRDEASRPAAPQPWSREPVLRFQIDEEMITSRAPASIPTGQASDLTGLVTLPDRNHSSSECPHWWQIESPHDGRTLLDARCKLCDATREFRASNPIDESTADGRAIRQGTSRLEPRRPGALMTHCRKGHEYTPENTRHNASGLRHCRACDRERSRTQRLEAKRSRWRHRRRDG